MEDSHVPLNPNLYAQENRHLGWNLINDELTKFILDKLTECRRMEQATRTKDGTNPK